MQHSDNITGNLSEELDLLSAQERLSIVKNNLHSLRRRFWHTSNYLRIVMILIAYGFALYHLDHIALPWSILTIYVCTGIIYSMIITILLKKTKSEVLWAYLGTALDITYIGCIPLVYYLSGNLYDIPPPLLRALLFVFAGAWVGLRLHRRLVVFALLYGWLWIAVVFSMETLVDRAIDPYVMGTTYLVFTGVMLTFWGTVKQASDLIVSSTSQLLEQEWIKRVFGLYVSRQVAEQILGGKKLNLGGERRTATILFADIRGFTALAETMEAEETVSFLNEYMELMVDVVMNNQGMIDKFMGDAIMAVFGSIDEHDDHAARAVRSALEMRDKLNEFNQLQRQGGKPVVKTGFGINTGQVVTGNIGSRHRRQFTVIGDTVNVASRLEGLTKRTGNNILTTRSVYEQIEHWPELKVRFKNLGEFFIRGRHESLEVFTVE